MKYIKLLLLFLLPFLSNAQSTYEHFAAYGTTGSISLVSADTFNFTITGFAGNARPYGASSFARADVLVGDKIFLNCNQYVIRSITSTAPNLVGTLYKVDGSTNNPTNSQVVAIIREYSNAQGLISYALPPSADGNGGVLSGINISLASCIQAHYSKKDSIAISNAISSVIYKYIGTTGVSPAVNASIAGSTTAQNTVGELWTWNPSSNLVTGAWSLQSGGGGTTETASNGLTKISNDIKLGGTLTQPTTITATLSNPFGIAGLPNNSNGASTGTGSNVDYVVTKGGTGDTFYITPSQYFLQLKDTSTFLVRRTNPTFTAASVPALAGVTTGDSLLTMNASTGAVRKLTSVGAWDSVSIKDRSVSANDAGQSLLDTIKIALSNDTFRTITQSKRETDYVAKFENVHKHQFFKWNNSTQILETLSLVNDTTAIYRKWWNTWTPYQANRDSFLTLLNISKVKISAVTDRASVPTITSTIYDFKVGGYDDLAIAARKAGTSYSGQFFPLHSANVTAAANVVNLYVDGVLQSGTTASYTYCAKIEIEQKAKFIIPTAITTAGIDTLFDVYNLTTILPSKFNTKNRLKAYQDVEVGSTYVGMLESGSGTHFVDGYGNVYSRTQGSDYSLPKNDQYTSFLMIDTNAVKRDFIYGVTVKNPYSTLRQSKVGFRRTASGQGEKVWYIATTGKLYGAVEPNTGTFEKWTKDTIWNTETEYITSIADNQYAFQNSISTIAQLPNSTVNGENWGVVADATSWKKTGNASTIEGTNYIGTTDAVGLVVKTNNTERLKIQNNGNVNINGGNVNNMFSIRGRSSENPSTIPIARFMNADSSQTLYMSNNTQGFGLGTTTSTASGVHLIYRPTNDALFYVGGAIPLRVTSTGLSVDYATAGIYNGNNAGTKFWFGAAANRASISTNSYGEMFTVKDSTIGISQTNPQFKLDINGTTHQPIRLLGLQAGATTDSIVSSASGILKRLSIAQINANYEIKSPNASIAIPAITGMTTGSVTLTVAGAVTGNTVVINPRVDISSDNVIIGFAYVSAADTVTIVFFGTSVGANGNISRNFDVTVTKN